MELRVLQYFLVVAQEGNITTAAARLHVGQPTLSRQLKDLERELGQRLFMRQAHGIRLTEEGQHLRQYAKEMVDLAEKVQLDFKGMRNQPMGEVYYGGMDINLDKSADLVRIALSEHPNLVFHYRSCSSSDALFMLDRGLLDFVVVSEYVSLKQYNTILLDNDRSWIALTRKDNPLARKASVRPEDLVGEPLLMHDQALKGPAGTNNLALWFGEDFSRLKVIATSNLASSLNAFAHNGLGTLLTLEGFAYTEWHDMTVLPLEPNISCRFYVAYRKDRQLSSAASYTLNLLEQRFGYGDAV